MSHAFANRETFTFMRRRDQNNVACNHTEEKFNVTTFRIIDEPHVKGFVADRAMTPTEAKDAHFAVVRGLTFNPAAIDWFINRPTRKEYRMRSYRRRI